MHGGLYPVLTFHFARRQLTFTFKSQARISLIDHPPSFYTIASLDIMRASGAVFFLCALAIQGECLAMYMHPARV